MNYHFVTTWFLICKLLKSTVIWNTPFLALVMIRCIKKFTSRQNKRTPKIQSLQSLLPCKVPMPLKYCFAFYNQMSLWLFCSCISVWAVQSYQYLILILDISLACLPYIELIFLQTFLGNVFELWLCFCLGTTAQTDFRKVIDKLLS